MFETFESNSWGIHPNRKQPKKPKIPRSYSPLPPLPNSLEWATFQATDLLTQTNLAVITGPAWRRFLYYYNSFFCHSFVIQWFGLSFLMPTSSCSAKIVLRYECVTELDLTVHSLPIGLLIILITYKRAFNRPRSIYQYSNMDPRLSSQIAIFFLLSHNSQKRLWKQRKHH